MKDWLCVLNEYEQKMRIRRGRKIYAVFRFSVRLFFFCRECRQKRIYLNFVHMAKLLVPVGALFSYSSRGWRTLATWFNSIADCIIRMVFARNYAHRLSLRYKSLRYYLPCTFYRYWRVWRQTKIVFRCFTIFQFVFLIFFFLSWR